MKRLFALLCAVVMALCLVGCGGPKADYALTYDELCEHIDKVINSNEVVILDDSGVKKRLEGKFKSYGVSTDKVYHHKRCEITGVVKDTGVDDEENIIVVISDYDRRSKAFSDKELRKGILTCASFRGFRDEESVRKLQGGDKVTISGVFDGWIWTENPSHFFSKVYSFEFKDCILVKKH